MVRCAAGNLRGGWRCRIMSTPPFRWLGWFGSGVYLESNDPNPFELMPVKSGFLPPGHALSGSERLLQHLFPIVYNLCSIQNLKTKTNERASEWAKNENNKQMFTLPLSLTGTNVIAIV